MLIANGLITAPSVPDRPDQPRIGVSQHGVFTRHQARQAGISHYHQLGLLASGAWVAVLGRVMRHRDQAADPWVRARAASLASGPARIVSHATAAALWGWNLPDPEFHVIRTDGLTCRELRHHRLPTAPQDLVDVGGWCITSKHRTIADLLCWGRPRSSVAWICEAFRTEAISEVDLVMAVADLGKRRGSATARRVALSCRGRPFSPLEWDFHQLAWEISPSGWRFNHPIMDHWGLIGRVDAWHEATGLVVELDGRAFHGDDRFQTDRSRDQRLTAMGLRVVRFTWDDVHANPQRVKGVLRAALRLTAA